MYSKTKRMMDVMISLVALLLFTPILIVISILIKLESKGPVLYAQKRSGQHGQTFKMYKFRSMRMDAPELSTDKLENPNRYVTRVGRFIRKYSLDELPQVFNILKGEMSIVGPRPALYNQYELIETRRHEGIDKLKPGITGYAQIMGRDFISDQQKVQYDKFYMENRSVLFDIKIIFRTFSKVVTSEGVKD